MFEHNADFDVALNSTSDSCGCHRSLVLVARKLFLEALGPCIGWNGKSLARSTQADLALSGQVICNVKWLRFVNVDCLSTSFVLPAIASGILKLKRSAH